MFYSSNIFGKLGINARVGSGLVGAVNMAATAGSLLLLGSKKFLFKLMIWLGFGRKTLLWTLSFGMAAA